MLFKKVINCIPIEYLNIPCIVIGRSAQDYIAVGCLL